MRLRLATGSGEVVRETPLVLICSNAFQMEAFQLAGPIVWRRTICALFGAHAGRTTTFDSACGHCFGVCGRGGLRVNLRFGRNDRDFARPPSARCGRWRVGEIREPHAVSSRARADLRPRAAEARA